MIIDTHQHVFWYGKDDKGLIADMDEQGIDLCWLLTWDIPPSEDVGWHVFNSVHVRPDGTHPGLPLCDVITAKQHYPDRFIIGYCPNPIIKGAAERFEKAYHMHGIRVCGEWKLRMLVDDPRSIELFRKAGELKCPVVIHLDVPYLFDVEKGEMVYQPNWYGGTIDNLERAMQLCPKTIFLGHAAGFWREISGDADKDPCFTPTGPVVDGGRLARLLEDYSNLYGDLSAGSALNALLRDSKYAKKFLCKFADRLCFARDYFGSELHTFLQSLDLPEDVQKKIYSGNAQRLMAQEPIDLELPSLIAT